MAQHHSVTASAVPFLDVAPIGRVAGSVRLPGSKSISNRTLLLAALATGTTELVGLLESDDTARMLEALATLGIRVHRAGTVATVHGAGGPPPVRRADLYLGNAGTAFRPLTAVLALAGGHYRLSGVPRMHERPIGDLVDALVPLGASIKYDGAPGFPPLTIGERTARGAGEVSVGGAVSSQFLTALLMAAPLLNRRITVNVAGELISKPYIELTLNLMARFGVVVERQGWSRFVVPAGARYQSPRRLHVEGDASSASYFLAAGAIGGGPVRVEGVGRQSIQGDIRFAETLTSMGATVRAGDDWIEVTTARQPLRAIEADFNHIPDAAMTVAVLALFADGPSTLRNIGSWRVKETDRIAAMAAELEKLGATVEAGDDFMRIKPPLRLRPATIDTYDDHRIAMCFSLAALGGVTVRINDPGCVAKTFPDYFSVLATLSAPPLAPVIAIDGPSASGKGTVAQRVAEALGWHYLDSGALYRVVALKANWAAVDLTDEPEVAALARNLAIRFASGRVYLDGRDVTDVIRSEAAGAGASKVAALPAVRTALLDRQRACREAPGLVADGRDMGSVVFPDATLKIFLTATPEARAQRRHNQLIGKGIPANLAGLLQELRERDRRDTTRPIAPLAQTADARPLDSTALSIDEVVRTVLEWQEAVGQRAM